MDGRQTALTATRLHELLLAEGQRVGVTVVKAGVDVDLRLHPGAPRDSRRSGNRRQGRLEVELQPELNDPPVAGAQDLAEAARFPLNVRRAEVRVVERVEQLRAELN